LNGVQLYGRYLGASLRSQMQYRASAIMQAFGSMVTIVTEFAAIWALFDRFGSLSGWSLYEIMLFYGTVNVAFSIAEASARGFDTFSRMIRGGDFDRILLRPRSPALQIAGQELQTMRVGRLLQGLAILIWGSVAMGLTWTVGKALVMLFAVIGGACLFAGLFILQATLCFWTTESLEVLIIVTYGGTETAQYPVTIYRKWFRQFFTYIVPLAAVTYYPIAYVLGRTDPLGSSVAFQSLAPTIGILFLVLSLQVWKSGIRHYRSTGS